MAEPTLRGRTVVCISSIDWNFLWQGHQEIATRLAAAGNRVVYIENTGVRTLRLSDLGRIVRRLRNWAADSRGRARAAAPGVQVVAPLLLPFPRSRLANAINRRILLPRLAHRLRASGVKDAVLFTFLPTPNAERLIELLRDPASTVVYYCIADFEELSDLGQALVESEARIARSADLVFVQSEAFARRLRPLNPRVHEFRFGVNLDVFDPARVERPATTVADLPRPIIGYSGGLHRHVDFGLLVELARAFPTGSIVLAGPIQTDTGPLHGEPNVHFLGSLPIHDLPAVMASFDVGLIPYARTAYTETVFPTKLYEYLAMGIPVVSTDLPEVRALGLAPGAVRVARDTVEFVRLVAEAVDDRAPGAAAARSALAQSRDWGRIVARMAALIAAPEG